MKPFSVLASLFILTPVVMADQLPLEDDLYTCRDRIDNDGDGLIDRKDGDCDAILDRLKAAKRAKRAELKLTGQSWRDYKKSLRTQLDYALIEEMESQEEEVMEYTGDPITDYVPEDTVVYTGPDLTVITQ